MAYHGHHHPAPDDPHALLVPAGFFADIERLDIGNGDLSINNELTHGASDIEGCYGIGLQFESKESKCLLAGSSIFDIADLELWAIN